jgi:hypothetical protein
MTLRSWTRTLFARPATRPIRKAPARRRPARGRLTLEALEDRTVPSTFTVMNTNNSGAGSLRQAILDANAQAGADVINFDPTAFSAPQTIRLLSSLPDITDDLTITGPTAARVTISGDANNDGVNDRGDVRILSVSAGNVTLSDLTLANGRAQGGDGSDNFIGNGGNGTDGQGGGIYVAGGTVTLNNATLSNNIAAGGNGGNGGEFGDGAAGAAGQGGAIYVAAGTVTLNDSTLSNATAAGGKGGNGGTPGVSSGIHGGKGGVGQGGGIFIAAGAVTLTNSTLSNDTAAGGTGGDGTASASIGGSGEGGGIYVAGTLTLINSTLSNDTAAGGTGGISDDGFRRVQGAPGRGVGGGLYNSGSTLTLNNTIIAGNSVTGNPFVSQDPNIHGSWSGGNNLLSGDPKLAPLGDYGGPTQTLALLPGSPALDAGENSLVPAGLTTDQRGLPRVSGGTVDIGAFESRGFTLTAAPGSTPQRAEVGTPFATALAVTLTANDPAVPVPDGTAIAYSVAPAAVGAAAALSAGTAATSGGQASVTAAANAFPGSYTVTAAIAGASPVTFDLDNYAVPSVTVNPVNLVYGTALADGQLSGTATAVVNGQTVSVPGTFSWGTFGNRTAGTVLGAGDNQFQGFTFAPADPASYADLGTSAVVNVARATPTVTWTAPDTITYGTPLSAAQLDAAAGWTVGGSAVTVAGTFTYTPAVGTILNAGSQTLSAHFVPADTTNYTTPADQAVSLTVTKADLYVTANANSKIVGETAHDTGTLSGVLNTDGITALFSSAGDAATAAAGRYAITAALADPNGRLGNYTVHETDASLTVLSYADATTNLPTKVNGGGLDYGLRAALDSKLLEAITAFTAGATADGVSQLWEFISLVNAQRGKKLAPATADDFLADGLRIIHAVG